MEEEEGDRHARKEHTDKKSGVVVRSLGRVGVEREREGVF